MISDVMFELLHIWLEVKEVMRLCAAANGNEDAEIHLIESLHLHRRYVLQSVMPGGHFSSCLENNEHKFTELIAKFKFQCERIVLVT